MGLYIVLKKNVLVSAWRAFPFSGGLMALVAAVLTRPRGGKFDATGQACRLEKQSPALNVLGGLILWAGWFFFNASGVRSFSEQPDSVSGYE